MTVWKFDSNLTLVSEWNLTSSWPAGDLDDYMAIDEKNSLMHFSNFWLQTISLDPYESHYRANIKTFI